MAACLTWLTLLYVDVVAQPLRDDVEQAIDVGMFARMGAGVGAVFGVEAQSLFGGGGVNGAAFGLAGVTDELAGVDGHFATANGQPDSTPDGAEAGTRDAGYAGTAGSAALPGLTSGSERGTDG